MLIFLLLSHLIGQVAIPAVLAAPAAEAEQAVGAANLAGMWERTGVAARVAVHQSYHYYCSDVCCTISAKQLQLLVQGRGLTSSKDYRWP